MVHCTLYPMGKLVFMHKCTLITEVKQGPKTHNGRPNIYVSSHFRKPSTVRGIIMEYTVCSVDVCLLLFSISWIIGVNWIKDGFLMRQ